MYRLTDMACGLCGSDIRYLTFIAAVQIMKFSTVVLINESASIFVFCFVSILLIELHLVDITVAVNGC